MIEILTDPDEFGAEVEMLLASTVRNTVAATVLESLRSGRFPNTGWRFALIRDPAGVVSGAALRTPPRVMLCTAIGERDAAQLIAAWLAADPELPGVNAVADTARALAAAYRTQTGGGSELRMSMALHALAPDELVDPPRPAAGELRAPRPKELELVVEWYLAFIAESDIEESPDAARASAISRVERDLLFVWEEGGDPVSLIGRTVAVAGVPRIGPVYTPPVLRGRGYASTAVAALSRRLFDRGARRVVLFTDLGNPTSNKIYAEVGYRRLADYEEHALGG
ncbi:MAG TPA: GNAT family N-acetyltransferase [Solirubrobacteraceae bacterium]